MASLSTASPIGTLSLFAHDDTIVELRFGASKTSDQHPNAVLKKYVQELQEYFGGKRRTFSTTLSPQGTDFQQKVWRALLAIPYGETITYQELAKRTGRPKAIRAAASACGKNPIPIFIPCHRVIASDGGLGGYSGGMKKKQALLDLEKN